MKEIKFIHLRMDAVLPLNIIGDQDMNAAVNPDCKNITPAAKLMLAWEATGKVRILKDKTQPRGFHMLKHIKQSALTWE